VHRKVVTVLFCDVVGSTALGESVDPEALRGLLARYFERMKAIVERHGGSVEKFIGDAVMAVFGVPAVHEDDALRACRAALEMREAFAELGVEGRIGVNTGEVVTGTEERLATGDAVNVAARLQQAAQPNEVLIGDPTLALLRQAAETEPVEPLELKGKSAQITAYRLIRLEAAPERSHESPFVGRDRELEQIRAAWERVGLEQRCELLTVVAEAGIGKTRLVAEAVTAPGTRVVGGRCLPYGEGITYWPVTATVLQLEDVEIDERVREPLRAVLGEDVQTTPPEIAWAFRKLVEAAAPVVVVFDDVQWGEDAFLDLIEHLELLATAPILVVAIARPELLDRRPLWPVALRLEPLAENEVEFLIGGRVSAEGEARILRAAGGNPLFVQELLAMTGDSGDVIEVPPNLHALLAARLDQLDVSERRVLERGAVEGELFHLGSVATLTPEEPNVTGHLASLVRRALVRPDRPQLPGEDGFRFRHLLIRDAAYDSLPKFDRADLHERFAEWLDDHGAELVELDEIVGYHLEQAARYRRELGAPNDSLAHRASERLAAAGTRAHNRADIPAALNLYARALEVRPPGDPAVLVRLQLGTALRLTGGAGLSAQSLLEGAEVAAAAGDHAGELALRVAAASSMLLSGSVDEATVRALANEALGLFEDRGDDVGQAFAYELLAFLEHNRVRSIPRLVAAERMLAHARAAGATWLVNTAKRQTIQSHIWGPTPFPEIDRMLSEDSAMLRSYPTLMARHGAIVGRLGRVEEGRALIESARKRSAEFGSWNLYWGQQTWDMEKYGGDLEAAERALRGEIDCGERAGMIGTNSSTMGYLAECLCALGIFEEVEDWVGRSRATTDEYDIESHLAWRKPQALRRASEGDHAGAEAVAWEAVRLADDTDDPTTQADARTVLAETIRLAGRREDAIGVLQAAIELYEAKGNVLGAAHAHERLDALREPEALTS
jgi:class 3 adenylate cyclase/tetratricopeptide (TPR) repeat protein